MQMLKQKKNNNRKLKKSHLLLIGSFLVFIGCFVLLYNHLKELKESIFSNMKIAMMDNLSINNDSYNTDNNTSLPNNISSSVDISQQDNVVDYTKYLGVLEIPKISLKRGFYSTNSKYNDIQFNVTLVRGSQMPDINNGNLILMAHSGDAYISFFAYLYKLKIGDYAYISYNGNKYKYQLVNTYNVDKIGKVTILRNYNKSTLTLITCTKDDDTHQTIYILEKVS